MPMITFLKYAFFSVFLFLWLAPGGFLLIEGFTYLMSSHVIESGIYNRFRGNGVGASILWTVVGFVIAGIGVSVVEEY